jgi:ribosomal protein S5
MYVENRKNQEFREFFEEFKEKNKDKWASIVNGIDVDPEILRQETFEELENKYKMLKQFSERKKLEEGIKKFDIIAENMNSYKSIDHHKLTRKSSQSEKFIREKVKPKRGSEKNTEKLLDRLAPDGEEGEIYDTTKFHLIYMASSMICKITRLNRIYNRKVLIFCGNKEGMISYGVGKGPLYQDAYENAFTEMKKNLILVEWDPSHTFPKDIYSRYHDFRFHCKSSLTPYWNAGPINMLMLRYCGFYHQNLWTYSRKKLPYSQVFSLFKLAANNTTIKKISEEKAKKAHHLYSSRGLRSVHLGMKELRGTRILHKV